jgi:hypothetical protein
MSDSDIKVKVEKGGCFGCLGFIVACIIFWALLFGVTWNGKHHGISCTSDKGVVIK